MVDNSLTKRSTVRIKTPNPLFEKWLWEWHLEEASEESSKTIYSQALKSLRKYPLVLKTGLECIILEHFDARLCIKLNKKLDEHNSSNGIAKNEQPFTKFIKTQHRENGAVDNASKNIKRKTNNDLGSVLPCQTSPKRKTKPYVPTKNSAAYALLLALILRESEDDYPGFMTKDELIIKAQKHANVSFKKPAAGSYYTGWNSMSQLLTKALVQKKSNPAKFSLTESGRELAIKLKEDAYKEGIDDNINHIDTTDQSRTNEVQSKQRAAGNLNSPPKKNKEEKNTQMIEFETEEMIFLPSSFDIFLLVDTAETIGLAKRDQDEMIQALRKTGIKFEVRHLKVGDYIWVAKDAVGREIVLPYIIERKRLDDLGSSIKDGRFHEQKFRLKLCGIPNRIYLVEDSGLERNGLPIDSIHQAITNTMVCDKFSIKTTRNLLESVQYLSTVTNFVTKAFQNKTLFSCKKDDVPQTVDLKDDVILLLSFAEFSHNMGKIKTLTPRETFAKQLIQMHGLSPEKAWVITEHYSTPKEIIEGFFYFDAEKKISQLTYGLLERKIGSQIAEMLKVFYTTREFRG